MATVGPGNWSTGPRWLGKKNRKGTLKYIMGLLEDLELEELQAVEERLYSDVIKGVKKWWSNKAPADQATHKYLHNRRHYSPKELRKIEELAQEKSGVDDIN